MTVSEPYVETHKQHHILEYDSAVAMRYHARRRSFCEFVSKSGTALSLILGTAAFGGSVAGYPELAKVAAASVAIVNMLNLAYGTAEAGRKHGDLFRKWAEFRAKLVTVKPDDEAGVMALAVERAIIDGESPGQLEALSILCENEEKEVRGSGGLYLVGPVQKSLANLLTFPWWHPKPE
jgi:hypothetical protein